MHARKSLPCREWTVKGYSCEDSEEKRRAVENASLLPCASLLLRQYALPTLASLVLLLNKLYLMLLPLVYLMHPTRQNHVIFPEHVILFQTFVPFTDLLFSLSGMSSLLLANL